MKLTRIRLDQFQQFRTPLDITGLDAGINLFIGPNESGKSTLARAIRAAFFERHKTGSLTHLQPWGDSSAAPEVSLEFDWQGRHWTLDKRFLQRKRSDLQSAGEQYNGDEADDRLAELLGYEFPGRGASKAEHWGIPGLLWVEQGTAQEVRDPVAHAGEHLQSALSQSLGDALGDVASSGGDALISQIERERSVLLTGTGRPTGELRSVHQECETLATALEELDEQVAQYRDRVDRLGELQRQRQDIDTARPWEEQQAKARKSQQQLDDVETLQRQQALEQRELEACQRNQQLYRQQLQDMESQAQQLEKRRLETAHAEQALEQRQANTGAIQQRQKDADAAYTQATKRLDDARQSAHRQNLQREQDRASGQLKELTDTLETARRLHTSVQQLTEQHQTHRVDSAALGKLQNVDAELDRLSIQQQALATRLGYRLEEGQQLALGEQTLSGSGEALLLEATELHVPHVGTFTIQPGGSDVAELSREQQRLTADRDALLQQLGVADLAVADARAKSADELYQRIQQERARLEGQAPEGVSDLEARQRLATQHRTQLADELAQLPPAEDSANLPDESQAQTDRQNASDRLTAAEQAEITHRETLSLAEQALTTAKTEWQNLNDELNAPDRQQRRQQAQDALTDLKAEGERLGASLQEQQHKISAANPDVLAQDVERFTRAAETQQAQAQQREREINDLRVQLDTLGAQGLEEKRDDTRQEQERLQRRRDELTRRADALELLLGLLKEQRQQLTRQLQAPLQTHLNRYLKLLFPGAELSVDDDLKPETLIRQGAGHEERGDLDALSFGAREQMGLITRLAYADLLQEAGRPTLIILDDALVHCDQERREQMKRILFDAAQRHQILLFTCHPENWQDLGVLPREMHALKMADTHDTAVGAYE